MKEQMWYFSFGSGQKPGLGWYAKYYGTYGTAREQMVADYNDKWSFQYDSAEACGVERFNLRCVNES